MLDRIYEVAALPQGEAKSTALHYRESGGGIAGTASVTVSRLGGRASYLGAVGDDTAGRWLVSELKSFGVALDKLQIISKGRTPSACAFVAPDGARCLVVDPGAASPLLSALPVKGFDAIMVDHRFPDFAEALLAAAPCNMPTVLDAEGGAPDILCRLVARARYPVFSAAGLRQCTSENDPYRALRKIEAPNAWALGVTCGAEGSLWLIDGTFHHVPAPHVKALDTTGCGDVFHGALALALAEGLMILEAARFATSAASLKARNGRGWHGMPDRAEVTSFMSSF